MTAELQRIAEWGGEQGAFVFHAQQFFRLGDLLVVSLHEGEEQLEELSSFFEDELTGPVDLFVEDLEQGEVCAAGFGELFEQAVSLL